MATIEYAVELGVYHTNYDIPPTVLMTTARGDAKHGIANLHDIITDLRIAVEDELGADVLDEQVFIRVFTR
jgi:hypothetical protein